MARKSKQPGGNFPLTQHERTKKFASSEYGTTAQRLAGHSQYQLGDCGISLTKLKDTDAVCCTPSGYLYAQDAIVEYLLTQTQELKEQRAAYERQQASRHGEDDEKQKQIQQQFEETQQVIRKRKAVDEKETAKQAVLKSSYWLAEAQPETVEAVLPLPPERPLSPHSQEPLRRKDIWPVALKWDDKNIVCEVSDKTIQYQPATAYWVDKKKPGKVVSTSVYNQLIQENKICPITSQKIKFTRPLQQSGSSFASSSQGVQVKKYRPTIT
jgi:nitric oxide synthase-interacting protein